LVVGAGGRRNQGQRQLVGHRKEDGPKERDAFPTRLSVSPIGATCGARDATRRQSGGMRRTSSLPRGCAALWPKPTSWGSRFSSSPEASR
jgi:hypothetical protein